jgi:hypothetical protein
MRDDISPDRMPPVGSSQLPTWAWEDPNAPAQPRMPALASSDLAYSGPSGFRTGWFGYVRWWWLICAVCAGLVVGAGITGGALYVASHSSSNGAKQPPAPTVYTVASVYHGTVVGVRPDNTLTIIQLTTTTTYNYGGQEGHPSELRVGVRFLVRGKVGTGGAITADRIQILLPTVTGVIQAIHVGRAQILERTKAVITIDLSPTAHIYNEHTNRALTVSDLKVGATITASGPFTSTGDMDPVSVAIQV